MSLVLGSKSPYNFRGYFPTSHLSLTQFSSSHSSGSKKASEPIIGIDLGTTNSCVALWENNEARVLENSEGSRTTPSVVAFPSSGSTKGAPVVVGAAARRQWVTNARNTIFATKRLIGRKYIDPMVQHQKGVVPYKIVASTQAQSKGDAWVETGDGVQHSPSEIGAHVLSKMKETAELHFSSNSSNSGKSGNSVKTGNRKKVKAVITCPAYFNDSQRQATKDAGRIAGLDVLCIINEPTAAALAYGLRGGAGNDGKIVAVFDLGGGTFDVSLLEIAGGVFEVKATNGDTYLGGEDFDNALVAYLAGEFRRMHPGSPAAAALVDQLERQGGKVPKEGKEGGPTLSKSGAVVAEMNDSKLALQRLREAAERAKCDLSSSPTAEINLPFLCMDAAKGPLHLQLTLTRAKFEALTEQLIRRTLAPVHRCLADAKLAPKDISEVVMVGGMTRMPRVVSEVRKAFNKEPFRGVNPDEAVAVGAAVQGGVLDGSVKSVVLLDVTPLSLGIETVGGVFTRLIPRNTTIPSRHSQVFSTAEDFQTEVEIKIFQGERAMAKDNKLLGSFYLTGIPPLPKGQAQIDVAFDIDANGIVHVKATDRRSGKEQSVRIEATGGLSEAEIQKMVAQADALKDADDAAKALAEARNAGEAVLRAAQTALKEHKGKVAKSELAPVNRDVEALIKAIGGKDPDAITRAAAALKESTMQCFSKSFADQANSNANNANNNNNANNGKNKK